MGGIIKIQMTTKELQKLNKVRQTIKVLKANSFSAVSLDTEGNYKKTFEKQMNKLSKNKGEFEYSGKGSLIKKLA